MQVTSTSNVNPGSAGDPSNTAAPSAQALTQSDFLKLLVAQLTSQDPLNPTSSQDLLTQTAQLSTLQSNTDMQSTLNQLQGSQYLTQATALLGRQVSLQTDSGTLTQGVVTGLDVSSGTAQILVNGVSYDLSQVLTIAPAPAS